MPRHKKSELALDNILDNIQNEMTEKNSDLNVFVGKEKMEICNNFVLLFYNSLLQVIDEYDLTKTDIKAILKILEYMQYGNLVNMSFAQLARDIGITPNNISRVIKKLKTSKLLIEVNKNLYLNPHVIAKGRFKKKDELAKEILEVSAEILLNETNLKPSILTPSIKNKIARKKIIENNTEIIDA